MRITSIQMRKLTVKRKSNISTNVKPNQESKCQTTLDGMQLEKKPQSYSFRREPSRGTKQDQCKIDGLGRDYTQTKNEKIGVCKKLAV